MRTRIRGSMPVLPRSLRPSTRLTQFTPPWTRLGSAWLVTMSCRSSSMPYTGTGKVGVHYTNT